MSRSFGGWCLILLLIVFLFLCVGATIVGLLLIKHVGATSFASFSFQSTPSTLSPSEVANNFLLAMKEDDNLQAYNSLDTSLLVLIMPNDFLREAKSVDTCSGRIAAFHLMEHKRQGERAYQYIFSVVRRKLKEPYPFQIVLHQNAEGAWTITSYGHGNSLVVPDLPACHIPASAS
ncbi:hypothetical protein KDA_76580 [Dictyobacter alpinus]|uniref:DUF4829 domain-containing protein n=1 Tax=Dictyobacter alpinus TaxID=2014873 RepID=A0A402BLF5_9CHLR|nr:hypothetical protein [Dictyobacter alpinus]GCE32174.1 hypothetical protein KDA_76580 [Dictyobacter alpinus]